MFSKRKARLAALLLVTLTGLPALSGAPAGAATPAPLGSNWSDVDKMPDFFTGMWESRSPMTDGPVEVGYTEAAKEYIKNYKPVKDIPLAGASCKSPGLPIIQRAGTPIKFMFQPGMVEIFIEQGSQARFIHLNAQHSESPDPTFLGESVAHFEGDTLVVDTIGFRDDIIFQYGATGSSFDPTASGGDPPAPGPDGIFQNVIFGPHGPNLRMVERMRLLDPDTLEIKLTIYDPSVFTTPYVSQPVQIYKRIRGDTAWPGEWACDTAIANPYDPDTNDVISKQPEETLKELGLDIK